MTMNLLQKPSHYAFSQGRTTRLSRFPLNVQARRTTRGKPPKKEDGKKKPQSSAIGDFIRQNPILNRLYDGTLVLGDCVMLAATEVSSERITFEDLPTLAGDARRAAASITMLNMYACSVVKGTWKSMHQQPSCWGLKMFRAWNGDGSMNIELC